VLAASRVSSAGFGFRRDVLIRKIIKALIPPGTATKLSYAIPPANDFVWILPATFRRDFAPKMDRGDECHVVRLLKEYGDIILDGTFLSRIEGKLSTTTSDIAWNDASH
jgi:hypothetical protein